MFTNYWCFEINRPLPQAVLTGAQGTHDIDNAIARAQFRARFIRQFDL